MPHYSPEEENLARRLFAHHYADLQKIAATRRRRADPCETMRTTDLLHEAFLRLDGREDWRSDLHFLRCAALAMRHVIIDRARRRMSGRHGGGTVTEEVDDSLADFSETPEQLVLIADLLDRLEKHNARWLRIVDARYFAGMTEVETASMLGLSERTVRRDWTDARAWIAAHL